MKNKYTQIFLLYSITSFSSIAAESFDSLPKCLHAFTQDNEHAPILPCGQDDKKIGQNVYVQAIMNTFGLPKNIVKFQSCPGGRFLAMHDPADQRKYVINYPSQIGSNYLAPISHELAHVMQMWNAGGLDALKPELNMRRIELGADFLAGIAYRVSLKHLDKLSFENNLELAGSYETKEPHSTPGNRSKAFRRGVVGAPPYNELPVHKSLDYWYKNDYQRLE